MSTLYYESSFAHHGVKGQKWGVRRYQNSDGTLTAAGRRHVYGESRKTQRLSNKVDTLKRQADDAKKSGLKLEAERLNTEAYKLEKGALGLSKTRDAFIMTSKEIGAARGTGEKVVTNLLAGPFANRTVNRMMAAGSSKTMAIGSSVVLGLLAGPVGHVAISAMFATDVAKGKDKPMSIAGDAYDAWNRRKNS